MDSEEIFFDLHAVSKDDCFFISSIPGSYGSRLSRYVNGVWRSIIDSETELEALSMLPGSTKLVALSRSERSIYTPPSISIENIPQAPQGYRGSLTTIKSIGSTLFACGMKGQIFKRDGAGRWELLAPNVLTDVEALISNRFIADLDGPNENEIYFAGGSGCLFWDGRQMRSIGPQTSQLTGVYVENERRVWICGWEGVLLTGNHADGMKLVENGGKQMFLSVAEGGGQLYLGATESFWTFDGSAVQRVVTGVKREPTKVTRISVGQDSVWAIGGSEVLRCAGGLWQSLRG